MTQERLRPVLLLGWVLASAVLLAASLPDIKHLWFPDVDDAMRLAQVRDWLGGQSWWDVSQHRLWNGHFAMHWSRLADLPLALVVAALNPFLGDAVATRIAIVAVPLATLLAVMALGAELTRKLCGVERAKTAVLLVPLSVPLVYQLRPMRIDHHGWQIVFALLAAVALVSKPTARSGTCIGLSLATLITISLEGLPITAAIMGVTMMAWAFDPQRRSQALAATWTMAGLVLVLHLVTLGPAMFEPACDAVAPAWILALVVVAISTTATMFVPRSSLLTRVGLLAAAGLAGIAALATIAPQCLRGPFGELDPFVRRFWYEQVSEGLPIWQQVPAWGIMTSGFPVAGLVGGIFAWRASEGESRQRWTMMLALAVGSFGLSLLVIRTGATANAFALPGGAWALYAMLARARAIEPVLPRAVATTGALLAATPGLAGSALFGLPSGLTQATTYNKVTSRKPCDRGREIADLRQLPASRLFAPIDVSPAILAGTDHEAIGAGYHRNVAAIHLVMATYMAPPEKAREAVVRTGAKYLVGCPGVNETEMYKQFAPFGLWSRLEAGERFGWLQPVTLSGSPVLVWRVIPPAHSPAHRGRKPTIWTSTRPNLR